MKKLILIAVIAAAFASCTKYNLTINAYSENQNLNNSTTGTGGPVFKQPLINRVNAKQNH